MDRFINKIIEVDKKAEEYNHEVKENKKKILQDMNLTINEIQKQYDDEIQKIKQEFDKNLINLEQKQTKKLKNFELEKEKIQKNYENTKDKLLVQISDFVLESGD